MNSLAAREASYTRNWSHTGRLAPASLAAAGFYYTPTDSQDPDDDTVTCFLCSKELGGWVEGDDPVQEHISHSKSCGWAILCSERAHPSLAPTSAALTRAREATFIGAWPHEKTRGFAGKLKKMAKAGWHFAPSHDSPDSTACIYCKTELDGWEATDDPVAEHERRARDLQCAFFVGLPSLSKKANPTTIKVKPEPTEDDERPVVGQMSDETHGDGDKGGKREVEQSSEPVAKRKAATKRKLPGKASTRNLDSSDSRLLHDADEKDTSTAIPINLQPTRKRRKSTEALASQQSSPVPLVRARIPNAANAARRLRSNSISSVGTGSLVDEAVAGADTAATRTKSRRLSLAAIEQASEHQTNAPIDTTTFKAETCKEKENIEAPRGRKRSSSVASLARSGSTSRRRGSSRGGAGSTNIEEILSSRPASRASRRLSALQPDTVDEAAETASSSSSLTSRIPEIVKIEEEDEVDTVVKPLPKKARTRASSTSSNTRRRSSSRGRTTRNIEDIIGSSSSVPATNNDEPSSTTTRPRRASSRRGSVSSLAAYGYLEEMITISSTSAPSTARPIEEASEVVPQIDAPSGQRRTSRRRAGSNASVDGSAQQPIEELLMLDSKARTRSQRPARRTASTSRANTVEESSSSSSTATFATAPSSGPGVNQANVIVEEEEPESPVKRAPAIAKQRAAPSKQPTPVNSPPQQPKQLEQPPQPAKDPAPVISPGPKVKSPRPVAAAKSPVAAPAIKPTSRAGKLADKVIKPKAAPRKKPAAAAAILNAAAAAGAAAGASTKPVLERVRSPPPAQSKLGEAKSPVQNTLARMSPVAPPLAAAPAPPAQQEKLIVPIAATTVAPMLSLILDDDSMTPIGESSPQVAMRVAPVLSEPTVTKNVAAAAVQPTTLLQPAANLPATVKAEPSPAPPSPDRLRRAWEKQVEREIIELADDSPAKPTIAVIRPTTGVPDAQNLGQQTPHQEDLNPGMTWEDIDTLDLYSTDLLQVLKVTSYEDLEPAELDMTVEQYIRHATKRQVDALCAECENLIARLVEGGQRTKAAIMAM